MAPRPPGSVSARALLALPLGGDREALAEQWRRRSSELGDDERDRIVNAALGLPSWAGQIERVQLEAIEGWVEVDRSARMEVTRRKLAELAALAEDWRWESLCLDDASLHRIYNTALGLPEDEQTGRAHAVVHERSWLPNELEAEFEMARRRLEIATPRRRIIEDGGTHQIR